MKVKGLFSGSLWIVVAYLYAGLVGGRLPYFILYASIGMMAVSLIWANSLSKVGVRASLHTNKSEVGKEVVIVISITNNSFVPLPWIYLNMPLPEAFGPDGREIAQGLHLKAKDTVEISIPLECCLRGFFQWGTIELKTGDIFGILSSSKSFESRLNLLVRPRATYLGKTCLRCFDARYGDRAWSIKPGRQVSEFRGVRAYTPGDSLSRIHWKASVKSQRFLVKEYDQSLLNEFLIFLDLSSTGHYGTGFVNTVERGIAVAASLSATAVQEGLSIGLAICADDLLAISPARSKGHLTMVLDFLARAVPGSNLPLEAALIKEGLQYPHGTMMLLITPQLTDELVRTLTGIINMGYKAVIVMLQPEAFGHPGINIDTRDELILRIKHLGIKVIMIDKDTNLQILFGGVQFEAC